MHFYVEKGGLTVLGGEPTFQKQGLIELLTLAKEQNISTCLETCGVFSKQTLKEIFPLVDMFLFDIKDTDKGLRENTNADLVQILDNLFEIDRKGGKQLLGR